MRFFKAEWYPVYQRELAYIPCIHLVWILEASIIWLTYYMSGCKLLFSCCGGSGAAIYLYISILSTFLQKSDSLLNRWTVVQEKYELSQRWWCGRNMSAHCSTCGNIVLVIFTLQRKLPFEKGQAVAGNNICTLWRL